MDKAFLIQKQARDNVKSFQSYLTDLQNWESEMKRKDAALNGEFEQDLPPIRSKIKKEKSLVIKKNPEKRIISSDYSAWEKFDVEKACDEVEMADQGPTSLDSKKSLSDKLEKLREEAQFEKERGNNFVKNAKWQEAISCYNRAIELVKDDAIYYANRGLCHLKRDSLHQAESDCTEALKLDPTYVKAYLRRATAREKLGSLRSASKDLEEVLKLEPQNTTARKQLDIIIARMGTKRVKSKVSVFGSPSEEPKPIKIVELEDKVVETKKSKEQIALENWRNGVGENINVIKPFKKPPHLRSKRALKAVEIKEIPLGITTPNKPPTRMKIIEIEDVDNKYNNNSEVINNNTGHTKEVDLKETNVTSKMTEMRDTKAEVNGNDNEYKLLDDLKVKDKVILKENMVPPVNSVQFMTDWNAYKGHKDACADYLSIIDPSKFHGIFSNALEYNILKDILITLFENTSKFTKYTLYGYLKGLSNVKRFGTLTMFLSTDDIQLVNKLLAHCQAVDEVPSADIAEMKKKFNMDQ